MSAARKTERKQCRRHSGYDDGDGEGIPEKAKVLAFGCRPQFNVLLPHRVLFFLRGPIMPPPPRYRWLAQGGISRSELPLNNPPPCWPPAPLVPSLRALRQPAGLFPGDLEPHSLATGRDLGDGPSTTMSSPLATVVGTAAHGADKPQSSQRPPAAAAAPLGVFVRSIRQHSRHLPTLLRGRK